MTRWEDADDEVWQTAESLRTMLPVEWRGVAQERVQQIMSAAHRFARRAATDTAKELLEGGDVWATAGDLEMTAPEDVAVERLCRRLGYGAVMAAAARLWRRADPAGARVVGPTVAQAQSAIAGTRRV